MKGENFLNQYFKLKDELDEKYTSNSVLLMQKGKFYEMYSIDSSFSRVCDLLGIYQTRADNTIKTQVNLKNPYMAGFPLTSLSRHLKTLTENNYTVQIVDEKKINNIIERTVTRTVTETTYIDDVNSESRTIMYILQIEQDICITIIDLFLGHITIYPDQPFSMDTIQIVKNKHKPREIVYHSTSNTDFKIDGIKLTYINTDVFLRVSYKIEFLEKVYKHIIGSNVIERLNLSKLDISSSCLVFCIDYTMKYDKTLVNKLSHPSILYSEDILQLSENSIDQLLLEDVFKEINKTHTPMGSRLLKQKLYNPHTNPEEMICTYLSVEEDAKDILKQVKDVDKLWRKINTTRVSKHIEITQFYYSMNSIQHFFKKINQSTQVVSDVSCRNLDRIIQYISNRLVFDDACQDIFKKGYNSEIDEKTDKINHILDEIENIRKDINDEISLSITTDKIYYTCNNDTKKYIQSVKKDISFSRSNKGWRITTKRLDELSEEYFMCKEELDKLNKKHLILFCEDLTEKYDKSFNIISQRVAKIDVDICCQTLINKYSYTIPKIQDTFTVKGLFHPISKNLHTGYIPLDITLNGGMLLYGINYSGKSTVLRSLGICVIMAQAGLPVPCREMVYKPFKNLYTKICLNDSYSKSQSTFTNEILEMNKMNQYCNEDTLILADELCSGTELSSALGLVGSSIIHLMNKKAKFIFTTHYHQLSDIKMVVDSGVEFYHMSVEINDKGILFNRKLESGKCSELYGIEIARYMNMNTDFIFLANKIRSEIVDERLVINKSSRYNTDVYMTECKVCGDKKGLHTHHIQFQSTFNKENVSKHFKGNLVVLCESCHQKVHKGELNISGYRETTEGNVIVE